jgi:CPA2 family monovalent cation:H+ antiporter-2
MILEIIVLTLFIATILNIVLHKFNMPTIIGYIITWTMVSYIFWFQDLPDAHYIETLAEFWIVFLMFTIGLEFSIGNFIKMRKQVFIYWWLQVLATFSIFYLVSTFLIWLNNEQAIIISLWLSLSSTAIVLKILNESGDINKPFWKKSLWILLFQDLMVIPILLLITIFSNTDANVWLLIGQTLISAVFLIWIMWLIGTYLLDYFLYKVSSTKSNEIFIWSVLFLVIWASLLAHFLGFSYSLWALIAGVIIAETHYKHQVEADLIPFRDLLLWFFFITVWMQLDIKIIYENLAIIFWLLFWLLAFKSISIYIVMSFFTQKRTSLKTALSLFQFWEFGIVIFQLATANKLIESGISQILILVIIISMIITPIILKNIWIISDFFLWHNHKNDNIIKDVEKYKDHVVLIWYGRLWKILSWLLEKQKIEYVILESYIKPYKEWKRAWKPIIFWNAFQVNTLKHVNIDKAKTILISVWKSDKLYLIADILKKMNIDWDIVVKVNNFEEETVLKKLHIENIIVETEKTALAMIWKVRI